MELPVAKKSPTSSGSKQNDSSDNSLTASQMKVIKIKHLNTEKLDCDNFYAWQVHVKTILGGYCLLQYEESFVLSNELMI